MIVAPRSRLPSGAWAKLDAATDTAMTVSVSLRKRVNRMILRGVGRAAEELEPASGGLVPRVMATVAVDLAKGLQVRLRSIAYHGDVHSVACPNKSGPLFPPHSSGL